MKLNAARLANLGIRWAVLRATLIVGIFIGAELMAGWVALVIYGPDIALEMIDLAGGLQ